MADPAAKKSPGPMRFILLGCGLLTGLFILGMGSCAGFMYFVYKGTDPVAEVGAEYLRKSPEVENELGQRRTKRDDSHDSRINAAGGWVLVLVAG